LWLGVLRCHCPAHPGRSATEGRTYLARVVQLSRRPSVGRFCLRSRDSRRSRGPWRSDRACDGCEVRDGGCVPTAPSGHVRTSRRNPGPSRGRGRFEPRGLCCSVTIFLPAALRAPHRMSRFARALACKRALPARPWSWRRPQSLTGGRSSRWLHWPAECRPPCAAAWPPVSAAGGSRRGLRRGAAFLLVRRRPGPSGAAPAAASAPSLPC
jgi:hypothetical protein